MYIQIKIDDTLLQYGMVINSDKTKFVVLNGNETDKIPITVHCHAYTYLGSVFTVDGKFSSRSTCRISTPKILCFRTPAFLFQEEGL